MPGGCPATLHLFSKQLMLQCKTVSKIPRRGFDSVLLNTVTVVYYMILCLRCQELIFIIRHVQRKSAALFFLIFPSPIHLQLFLICYNQIDLFNIQENIGLNMSNHHVEPPCQTTMSTHFKLRKDYYRLYEYASTHLSCLFYQNEKGKGRRSLP